MPVGWPAGREVFGPLAIGQRLSSGFTEATAAAREVLFGTKGDAVGDVEALGDSPRSCRRERTCPS